jgi:hypothetical protein
MKSKKTLKKNIEKGIRRQIMEARKFEKKY